MSYLTIKFYRWLENESHADIDTNGERDFLESMIIGKEVTVFDVGANEGQYAKIAQVAAQKNVTNLTLHAFEPVAKYEAEGILNKEAVSDTDGEMTFFHYEDNDDGSSFYHMPWIDKKSGRPKEIKVPTIRLDTYIKTNNIQHIDVLKIDVEGHEMNVLKGLGEYLRPDFVTAIQFEYAATAAFAARTCLFDFVTLFAEKNFALYKVFPKHLERFNYDGREIEFANFVATPATPKRAN